MANSWCWKNKVLNLKGLERATVRQVAMGYVVNRWGFIGLAFFCFGPPGDPDRVFAKAIFNAMDTI
jgi:uncharacterized membrane protein